jgi:polyisoprenoid-binding protein YceI
MTTHDSAFRLVRRLCAILMLCAFGAKPTSAGTATRWTIDPANAHIEFAIDGFGHSRTRGLFRRFEGHLSVDFERLDRSTVTFHVQSGSVDAGSPTFDDYLRSAAFLDADRHQTIDFVSRSILRINDHTVRVSGDLTLLGLRKPLSVEVTVTRGTEGARQSLGFLAQTRIDRLAFGMNLGFPLISREVDLLISSGVGQESTMLERIGVSPDTIPRRYRRFLDLSLGRHRSRSCHLRMNATEIDFATMRASPPARRPRASRSGKRQVCL